jgi:hypothetical protein
MERWCFISDNPIVSGRKDVIASQTSNKTFRRRTCVAAINIDFELAGSILIEGSHILVFKLTLCQSSTHLLLSSSHTFATLHLVSSPTICNCIKLGREHFGL